MLAHRAAVLWKRDLRDSTCRTPCLSPSRLWTERRGRALQMEKSQTSG